MRHTMKITVGAESNTAGVLSCRHLTLREKLLRFLLGSPVKLTVLIPGNTVEEVEISKAAQEVVNETV